MLARAASTPDGVSLRFEDAWARRVTVRAGGYARTLRMQLGEVAATCLQCGIRIVANAGGMDPPGCAAAVRATYEKLGLVFIEPEVE